MTGGPAAFDVRDLAAEHDFVRRLAHSLVFDRDRADDAAQDAWVAALRQPPRDPQAAPAWFLRVLHNLVRRRARDDARREQREQVAAAAEALPSAAAVLEREQQRRRVVDAVLALPEPYRGTVLARFFDDLQPAEIARRRGVPAATVRSQLLRGLEQLRTRLDGEHGGDRRAWCLQLLPLARPAATAGSLSKIAGALLMAKVLMAAGVLALGLLSWAWFSGDGAPLPALGTAVASVDAPAAATSADRPVDLAAPEALRRPAEATAAATPAVAPAGLRGRVVSPGGAPVPGCLVRVLGIDGTVLVADLPAHGPGPELPHGDARTGVDGTFRIDGLWPRARYAVHADADGDDRTLHIVDATPGPGEVADVGDVVLTQKGKVVGRAVDDDDAPVAGAEVLAMDLPAALSALLPLEQLDPAQGALLTLPVPPATGADLAAFRSVLRSYLAGDIFQRSGLDEEPGTAMVVVDGVPWAQALWRELPIARATTAADGSFVLRGVEPGANVVLMRRHGLAVGSRPRVAVRAGTTTDVGDVKLRAGEQLTGTVRSADGAAIAGAEIRVGPIGVLGYRGIAFTAAPGRSDGSGRFRIGGLPRGRAFVAVRADSDAPWHTLGPVDAGDDLQVDLPAGLEILLALTRADGAPVRDVEVEAFAGPPLNELRRAGLQPPLHLGALEATRDGALRLSGLPPGCVTLRVAAADTVPVETVVVLPHDGPLPMTLPEAAPLCVRVRDADGRPVAGATIYLHRKEPSPQEQNVMPTDYGLPRWSVLPRVCGATDAGGELRVADRPAADVVVLVRHPRLPPAQREVTAATATVELQLPRPGELRGRVFHGGAPADPRAFTVVAEADELGSMPMPQLRAGLAADGSFAFQGVAPGTWRLHAARRRAAPLSLQSLVEEVREQIYSFGSSWTDGPQRHAVEVVPGEVAALSFDVDPNVPPPGVAAARIVGSAVIDGQPLAGAVLERKLDWFRHAELCTVAPDGSILVTAVTPGHLTLRLRQGEATLWQGDIDLPAGGEVRLDLGWASGSLHGTASFADGRATLDVEIVAEGRLQNGTVERRTALGRGGGFRFAQLPPGDYRVRADGEARSEPVAARITAGAAAAPVHLSLSEMPSLRGRFELGGVDPAGMLLLLIGKESMHGVSLGADGSFAFRRLEPGTYELQLQRNNQALKIAPSTFDLSHGPLRDVVVTLGPPAAGGGR